MKVYNIVTHKEELWDEGLLQGTYIRQYDKDYVKRVIHGEEKIHTNDISYLRICYGLNPSRNYLRIPFEVWFYERCWELYLRDK